MRTSGHNAVLERRRPTSARASCSHFEVKQALEQAEALLEPGEIVQGPGEAIPALGYDETPRGIKRKMGNYRLRPRGHLPVQRFRVVIFVQTPK